MRYRFGVGQFAYLQMVSESSVSDVAPVLRGRPSARPADIASAVAEPHEYLILAMLGQLVRGRPATKVGAGRRLVMASALAAL